MLEIGTSGSMSGEGKRGDAAWPKLPRLSSTLPIQRRLRMLSFPVIRDGKGLHTTASPQEMDKIRARLKRAGEEYEAWKTRNP